MSYPKSLVIAALGMTIFVFISLPLAFGATSDVGQAITSGDLTVTGPVSMSFDRTVVQPISQITNGILSSINVADFRGTGAGWSSSMTIQNLTFTGMPLENPGNTSPLILLDTDNRYDGSCGVSSPMITYTVTIVSSGSVGTSTYSVTGGCSDTNQSNVATADTGNDVGTRGLKIKFPVGFYAAGDFWTIPVDLYPYTAILVTPQAPTAAVAGSDLTGVTEGDAETLTGAGTVSSPKVLLTAASDSGMGSYDQDVLMQLTVHSFSQVGSYTGVIVLNFY